MFGTAIWDGCMDGYMYTAAASLCIPFFGGRMGGAMYELNENE